MSERRQLSKRARFAVLMRDSFRCIYCGAHGHGVVLQVDHVEPVAEGGGNHQGNLVTACIDCNNGKGAQSLAQHPLSDEAGAESLLIEALNKSGLEAPRVMALGMVAGALDADYALDSSVESRARALCDESDIEAGAIAAMLPREPVQLARIGLRLFAGRTDPASELLLAKWRQRIAADKAES